MPLLPRASLAGADATAQKCKIIRHPRPLERGLVCRDKAPCLSSASRRVATRPRPRWSSDAAPRIRANLVLSQLAEHRPYGGVVPEIAARAHLDHLDGLIARALDEAGIGFGDLDARRRDRRARPHRRRHRRRDGRRRRSRSRAACRSSRSTISKATRSRRGSSDDVAVSLSAAAGFGRPLPAAGGRGRRALSPPRHHDRRRRGRGVRQGREAAGPAAIPAARRSSARRATGDPARFSSAAADAGAARAAISRSPASRRRCAQRRGAGRTRDRPRRSRGRASGGDRRLPGRSHRATRCAASRDRPPARTLVAAGGVAANRALRARLEALAAATGLAFVAPPPRALHRQRRDDRAGPGSSGCASASSTGSTSRRGRAGRSIRPRRPRPAPRSRLQGRRSRMSAGA